MGELFSAKWIYESSNVSTQYGRQAFRSILTLQVPQRPTISVNQNNGVVSYGGNYSNSEPAGGGSVTGAGYLCIAVK